MDRIKARNLAMAVALAFAVTPAFAHGDRDVTTSSDNGVSTSEHGAVTTAPNATPSSNPATAWDTGKTSPYSGALGQESTPTTSDEDHNDEGAYPPAPPRADTSNVPPKTDDSRASTSASDQPWSERPSAHPGSEEHLDGMRSGQG
jgi:hypothetical protein